MIRPSNQEVARPHPQIKQRARSRRAITYNPDLQPHTVSLRCAILPRLASVLAGNWARKTREVREIGGGQAVPHHTTSAV